MKRFFITLSYDGENYCGWQIQPNAISVQQKLQEALSTIMRKNIAVVGAGRTDSGVHARHMIAHFDWEHDDFDAQELALRLNKFLPKDIAIQSIKEVASNAHARFDATSRTYSYRLTRHKDPYLYKYKYHIYFNPDIELMNRLCEILLATNDFTSFSKLHTDVKTNICKVSHARWEKTNDGDYLFTIKADRFLRNMVRSIVGTLLLAGRGKLDEEGFREIIAAKDRGRAGESAPGHALFLEKVEYPHDIWI
ncbi:MAG TPA: tRNA pseudouridine(38-40) synthase TruA [Bacteroidales bacterium]|nr:tRNA pseudouridine(38-40) synthase TruA [Bacteroidales bacterium]